MGRGSRPQGNVTGGCFVRSLPVCWIPTPRQARPYADQWDAHAGWMGTWGSREPEWGGVHRATGKSRTKEQQRGRTDKEPPPPSCAPHSMRGHPRVPFWDSGKTTFFTQTTRQILAPPDSVAPLNFRPCPTAGKVRSHALPGFPGALQGHHARPRGPGGIAVHRPDRPHARPAG